MVRATQKHIATVALLLQEHESPLPMAVATSCTGWPPSSRTSAFPALRRDSMGGGWVFMTAPPSASVFHTSIHKRILRKILNWEAYMPCMHSVNARQMLYAVYLIYLNRKAPASRHRNLIVISKYCFWTFIDCSWDSVGYSAFHFRFLYLELSF